MRQLQVCLLLMGAASACCIEEARGEEAAGTVLSACQIPDVKGPARCGAFEVAENPKQPNGKRLKIAVAVIPATGGKALPDPIVVLMGGPGENTITEASYFVKTLASLRDDRDMLFVDQRGTGRSEALACKLYSEKDPGASVRNFFPPESVKRCLEESSRRADLSQYTFAHIANDLEHVRKALGYGPLNLSAGSYGTRAAQVYMRMYPKSVRTAYLGSVVPIDIPSPLPFAKTADSSLENMLNACAADAGCGKAFPSLREELREVTTKLKSGTVSVSVPGSADSVPLSAGRVAEWIRSRLYRPSSTADLPWLIHQAYGGNWMPIVEGILSNARDADTGLNFGQFFSITCNEDVAFLKEEDIERETKGTFLGDYRIRQQQAACKQWPKAVLAADYRMPVRTSVPTMFVSGDADGGTPLWYTDHVAQGFSQRIEVVARGQGHTEWSDCVAKLYERFVRSGTTNGLSSTSCEVVPRPPFKLE
jgi:pimeloyl-ACP methyl ester carboxylesterase